MDIKILVAAHKKYWMPDDDVYVPLHVGAAGKESLGYLPDNTGDHISSKNPSYCELTGPVSYTHLTLPTICSV